MRGRRVPKHECDARQLTITTLLDASDELEPGSVECIFVVHAVTHFIESCLSESYGCRVQIVAWSNDGVEILCHG